MEMLKKQGVAWIITAVLIAAAIAIGFAKGSGNKYEYIYDGANVLSASTEKTLADRNSRLIDRYGVAIGVITCNNQGNLRSYALKQGKKMGLTDYDFIVVLDIRADDYYFIGIEGYFTDRDCSDYVERYMERDFARGDYNGAVRSLTEALEDWCIDVLD